LKETKKKKMTKWIKSKFIKHYKQFFKYSIFGFICFVVDYLLTVFLVYQFALHYLLASTLGYALGIVLNYCFSITWVFAKRNLKDIWHVEMTLFFTIEIVALLIMNLFIYLSHDYIHVDFLLAKLFGNIAAFTWNYIIKHIFLFRGNPKEKAEYLELKRNLYDKD